MTKKALDLNFEEVLNELEAMIETIETRECSLEESLKNFEKGISLAQQCQKLLKIAEQKVQILTVQNGEYKTETFIEEE